VDFCVCACWCEPECRSSGVALGSVGVCVMSVRACCMSVQVCLVQRVGSFEFNLSSAQFVLKLRLFSRKHWLARETTSKNAWGTEVGAVFR
jgi:hypothetical protein